MLKEILACITALLSDPAKTWVEISQKDAREETVQEENIQRPSEDAEYSFEEEDSKKNEKHELFLKQFLYPLLGFATLAAFIGGLVDSGTWSLEQPLKKAILTFCSYFGGLYLAAIALKESYKKLFGDTLDRQRCQRFVGYSLALPLLVSMFLSLFPSFFFLMVCDLYIVYIVWEGAEPYMGVPKEYRLKFTAIASLLVLLVPFIIERLFFFVMPGLR